MTIQVELSLETEARLTAAAKALGVPSEKYASDLLFGALANHRYGSGRLTVQDVESLTQRVMEASEGLPILPESALSRESFYEDRG